MMLSIVSVNGVGLAAAGLAGVACAAFTGGVGGVVGVVCGCWARTSQVQVAQRARTIRNRRMRVPRNAAENRGFEILPSGCHFHHDHVVWRDAGDEGALDLPQVLLRPQIADGGFGVERETELLPGPVSYTHLTLPTI